MSAPGRCEISATRRERVAGSEVRIAMRMDRSATTTLINDLAAAIGMRATLAPIGARDDDGTGNGEGK